jgi:UDP-glucuronate decarboxylase
VGETLCVAYGHQYEVRLKLFALFTLTVVDMIKMTGVFLWILSGIRFSLVKPLCIAMEKATRFFCYISDAVAGFFTVLLMGKSGECFNVASLFENSILDFANTVFSAFSSKIEIKIKLEKKTEQYATSPI